MVKRGVGALKLSLILEGLFSVLCRDIGDDNKNTLKIKTKKDIAKKLNLPLPTFNRHFKSLEDNNLIKFKRGDGVFINPEYYRKSTIIEKSTLEMFSVNSNSFYISGKNCIYFLFDENKTLLYIGKTINLNRRISQHKTEANSIPWKNNIKFFNYVEFESEADMHLYEVYYIAKLKPIENKDFSTKDILSIMLPEKSRSDFIVF